ncbi:MAG TPA: hypothetical protein VD738_11050 [Nitrospira sp.]|nr:hypothetical protein [Nitrospira sp.]
MRRWIPGLILLSGVLTGVPVQAESETSEKPGVMERIGNGAKKVGNKIEQGFTKAGRKLEEKKIGEKIERKLKKAASKTAEGFKKAGDKIDQKLNH